VAAPTARLTMNPTTGTAVVRAAPATGGEGWSTATATHREPPRRPRRAAEKSADRRMRWLAASIGARDPPPRDRSSGRQPRAALGPAGSENAATSAGAHAQPEPVRLGPAPVVRLERPLAHWSRSRKAGGWRTRGCVLDRWSDRAGRSVPASGGGLPARCSSAAGTTRAQPDHGTRPVGDRSNRRACPGHGRSPPGVRESVTTRRTAPLHRQSLVDNTLFVRGSVVSVAADQCSPAGHLRVRRTSPLAAL